MLMVSKRKYNKLLEEYESLRERYDQNMVQLSTNSLMMNILRNRSMGLRLIDEEIEKYECKEDIDKLNILKRVTMIDACYSNYITFDSENHLRIDVQQIPWSAEQMKSMLTTEDFING